MDTRRGPAYQARITSAHHVSLGRWEFPIEVLVVANLVALAFETLPTLSPFWRQALWSFEVFCAMVYTVEYGVRLYLARPRLKYVTSFYGIIDLLAIVPFYLMVAFNLQAVRAFRLLRLLRLFKLVRYTQATHRFRRAFDIARDDLVLFGVIALIVLYLSAIGIYHFEHEAQPEKFSSVFDSLWWAVATLTTVGYGDIYPDHAGRAGSSPSSCSSWGSASSPCHRACSPRPCHACGPRRRQRNGRLRAGTWNGNGETSRTGRRLGSSFQRSATRRFASLRASHASAAAAMPTRRWPPPRTPAHLAARPRASTLNAIHAPPPSPKPHSATP